MNLSWGYYDTIQPKIMSAFFDFAKDKIVVVAGVGNKGINLDTSKLKFWPACFAKTYDFVISVGAFEHKPTGDEIATFSNYGNDWVDIYARGVGVQSLTKGSNKLSSCDGTSMATPYVSRTAAILRGRCLTKSSAEIKACIKKDGKSAGTPTQPFKRLNSINPSVG